MSTVIHTRHKKNYEGARVGVLDADDQGKIFLWVGRHDDTDSEERIAVLDKKEIARLINILAKELAK